MMQGALAEHSLRNLVVQTAVLTHRQLVRLGRNPVALLFVFLMPIFFLLALNVVLGDRVSAIEGHSALYGTVPMNVVTAATFGSMVVAVSLAREQTDGLLSRFWVMPVHRASGLLARMVSEVIRIVFTTAMILGVGLVLGFRFREGGLATVAWFAVPVIYGLAVAILITTVALYWANTPLVEAVMLAQVLLALFSIGFVPLAEYPSWIQPVVRHQPLTYVIEAMQGLSVGGPVLSPLTGVLAWSTGIVAVCLIPMALGYRRASMR